MKWIKFLIVFWIFCSCSKKNSGDDNGDNSSTLPVAQTPSPEAPVSIIGTYKGMCQRNYLDKMYQTVLMVNTATQSVITMRFYNQNEVNPKAPLADDSPVHDSLLENKVLRRGLCKTPLYEMKFTRSYKLQGKDPKPMIMPPQYFIDVNWDKTEATLFSSNALIDGKFFEASDFKVGETRDVSNKKFILSGDHEIQMPDHGQFVQSRIIPDAFMEMDMPTWPIQENITTPRDARYEAHTFFGVLDLNK